MRKRQRDRERNRGLVLEEETRMRCGAISVRTGLGRRAACVGPRLTSGNLGMDVRDSTGF
jgi:hypothetical protein